MKSRFKHRPRNKANMSQPQEEFISPTGTQPKERPSSPSGLMRGQGRKTTQNSLRAP